MGSSRTITLLVGLIVISLGFILLSGNPQFAPIQSFFYNLAAPVQRTTTDASQQVSSWIITLQQMHTLQQQNQQLIYQNQLLTADNLKLKDLQAQIDNLQKILNFHTSKPEFKIMPANVLGFGSSSLTQEIVIDKGTRDGIRVGMAVTSPGGYLIGSIRTISADRSNVLLVTDVDSRISIVVQRPGIDGTVEGQAQNGGSLSVAHIGQDADVQAHDIIVTSGAGGTMPRGLVVGQITDVHQSDVAMEQAADAYPLAQLEMASLAEVLIVTSATDTFGATGTPVPGATPGTDATPGAGALYPVPPTQTPSPTVTPTSTLTPAPTLSPTRTSTPTRTPRPTVTPRKG